MTLLFFLKSHSLNNTTAVHHFGPPEETEWMPKRKLHKTRKEKRNEVRRQIDLEMDELDDEELLLMLGFFDD